MSFPWADGRSTRTPFNPLPKDLGLMDNLIFSFRRWVGLSPLSERANSWLGLPRSEKKKKKSGGKLFYAYCGQCGGGEEQDCV